MAMSTAGQIILEEDQIGTPIAESLLTTDDMEVDRPVVKHISGAVPDQQHSSQPAMEQSDATA